MFISAILNLLRNRLESFRKTYPALLKRKHLFTEPQKVKIFNAKPSRRKEI